MPRQPRAADQRTAVYFLLPPQQEAQLTELRLLLAQGFLHLTPEQAEELLPKTNLIRIALFKGLDQWIKEVRANPAGTLVAKMLEATPGAGIIPSTSLAVQERDPRSYVHGAAATSTSVAAVQAQTSRPSLLPTDDVVVLGADLEATSVGIGTDPINVSSDTAIRMKQGKKPKKTMAMGKKPMGKR